MALITKYRPVITGFMMALYVFIMVPVQVWHQHQVKSQNAIELSMEKKSLVSIDKNFTAAIHHCAICDHHYSFYIDEDPPVKTILLTAVHHQYQEYLFQIPGVLPRLLSNKGPPSLST